MKFEDWHTSYLEVSFTEMTGDPEYSGSRKVGEMGLALLAEFRAYKSLVEEEFGEQAEAHLALHRGEQ